MTFESSKQVPNASGIWGYQNSLSSKESTWAQGPESGVEVNWLVLRAHVRIWDWERSELIHWGAQEGRKCREPPSALLCWLCWGSGHHVSVLWLSFCCSDASAYIKIAHFKRKDDDHGYVVSVWFIVSQRGGVKPHKEKDVYGVVVCVLFSVTIGVPGRRNTVKGGFLVWKKWDSQYLPSCLPSNLSSVTAPGHLIRISSNMRNVFSMVTSLSSLFCFSCPFCLS